MDVFELVGRTLLKMNILVPQSEVSCEELISEWDLKAQLAEL